MTVTPSQMMAETTSAPLSQLGSLVQQSLHSLLIVWRTEVMALIMDFISVMTVAMQMVMGVTLLVM